MDDERPANNPTPPRPRRFWAAIMTAYRDILLIILGSVLSLIGSCIGIAAQDAQWRRTQDVERMKRAQDRATQVFEDLAQVLNQANFHLGAVVAVNPETTADTAYAKLSAAFLAAADSFMVVKPRNAALVSVYFDTSTAQQLDLTAARLKNASDRLNVRTRLRSVLREMEKTPSKYDSAEVRSARASLEYEDTRLALQLAINRIEDEKYQKRLAARILDGNVGLPPERRDSTMPRP